MESPKFVTECGKCGNICYTSEEGDGTCPRCGPINSSIVKHARYSEDENTLFFILQGSLVRQTYERGDRSFSLQMKQACEKCTHRLENHYCKLCPVTQALNKRFGKPSRLEMDSLKRRQYICDMLLLTLQSIGGTSNLQNLKYIKKNGTKSTIVASFDDVPDKEIEVADTTDSNIVKAIVDSLL